ncbi:uncharacterized protein TNCV_3826221 [Trichonephila clavipes]|nr:uncharacterized protein TNCV_3826221 [Trichonephila clavipes]
MANNQSVRRHLDAFTRGRIIGKLEEGRSVTSVAAEFGIAHSIVSRLWRQFQTTGTAIQLIPLLPIEIAEIVAKEPLEKSDDYPHIKNLLLARFQLTPIALRDRFESHQRRPGAMWADLVFELRSYLDNWLAGMKVGDFAALKELLVTEQIKKRAPSELVDHFLDS